MSEYLAEALARIFDAREFDAVPPTEEAAAQMFNLNSSRLFTVNIEQGRWATKMATWRYAPSNRFHLAQQFFLKAVVLSPDRFEGPLGLTILFLLQKDYEEAQHYFERAKKLSVEGVRSYFKEHWVQNILERAGVNYLRFFTVADA